MFRLLSFLLAYSVSIPLVAQRTSVNYDEARVPAYQLPPLLRSSDGRSVTSPTQWRARRAELLTQFEKHVYGHSPQPTYPLRYEVVADEPGALGGTAIRREVVVYFTPDRPEPAMTILLYLPAQTDGPVPLFLGLNFYGNHTIHPDPSITLSERWMRTNDAYGIVNHRATEASRGVRSWRWPVEKILERGYGLATVYCGDLDPDENDPVDFQDGVHPLFYAPGQTKPKPDEWGAISAWAWGLQRAMDYLATDAQVDTERVAVIGHSRLGKAALWAGAQDERFAMVISNNSGCGGAALSRRRYGETVAVINNAFPHWFCDNFTQYNGQEDQLPVDQHQLVALVAPRPVYVASAEEDRWADPRGEFLAVAYADSIYQLLGISGLPVDEMPAVENPAVGTIGYHVRSGKHDITDYDWAQYLDFADRHLRPAR